MLRKKTVFILGAGASKPYGYPLGKDLVRLIASHSLSGNSPLVPRHDEFLLFRRDLQYSGVDSIDTFLETQSTERQAFGRLLIADVLSRIENPDNICGISPPIDHWYEYLLNKLLQGVAFNVIHKIPVRFITFNYDRSLEYFLLTALLKRFPQRPQSDVLNILKAWPIIHLHGDLGPLPLFKRAGVDSCDYGPDPTSVHVTQAASQIKVIQDVNPDTDEFTEARKHLDEAERIYFLGFGYRDENMERLGIPFGPSLNARPVRTFGTAFDISDGNREVYMETYPGLELGDKKDKITAFLDDCRVFLRDLRES